MVQEPKLSSLYQQVILDHYRNPRNKAAVDDPDVAVHMRNPTCGDEIRLELAVEDDRIARVGFTGQGCSISQAAASMLTQMLEGKPVKDALHLAERFTAMMHGDEDAAKDRSMGDMRALAGVSNFPVRVKCALLGIDALQEALQQREDTPTQE